MELGVHAGATGVLREPVKARTAWLLAAAGKYWHHHWMDCHATTNLLESTISGYLNTVEHDLRSPGISSLLQPHVPYGC
eukprot:218937-Hanusia_phi.AAC.1